MIREIAHFIIKPGQGDAFVAAVAEFLPIFKGAQGFRYMSFEQTVEDENRFYLLIEWDTLEDHTRRFRESEGFGQWRARVGGFFAQPPEVVHTKVFVHS